MKLGHTLRAGIALTVVVGAASAAQAAAVSFFGNNPNANGGVGGAGPDPVNQRNLFRNSLATLRVESFEARTSTPTPSGDTTVNDIFGASSGVTLSASNPNGGGQDRTRIQQNTHGGTPGNPGLGGFLGRFSTTGDSSSVTTINGGSNFTGGKWWETNFTTVTVQFTTAVAAFGTFMTDLGDFDGGLAVDFFSDTTAVDGFQLLNASGRSVNGGLAFFGYTNDITSFNRVVFTIAQGTTNPSNYDTVGFDDFITGTLRASTSVPEPTSIALVGLSLVLLSVARRRQTKA